MHRIYRHLFHWLTVEWAIGFVTLAFLRLLCFWHRPGTRFVASCATLCVASLAAVHSSKRQWNSTSAFWYLFICTFPSQNCVWYTRRMTQRNNFIRASWSLHVQDSSGSVEKFCASPTKTTPRFFQRSRTTVIAHFLYFSLQKDAGKGHTDTNYNNWHEKARWSCSDRCCHLTARGHFVATIMKLSPFTLPWPNPLLCCSVVNGNSIAHSQFGENCSLCWNK